MSDYGTQIRMTPGPWAEPVPSHRGQGWPRQAFTVFQATGPATGPRPWLGDTLPVPLMGGNGVLYDGEPEHRPINPRRWPDAPAVMSEQEACERADDWYLWWKDTGKERYTRDE